MYENGEAPDIFVCAQLLKKFGEHVHVDIIDRLPTPFGLVRSGVAPDHQDTKVCPNCRLVFFICSRVEGGAADCCSTAKPASFPQLPPPARKPECSLYLDYSVA